MKLVNLGKFLSLAIILLCIFSNVISKSTKRLKNRQIHNYRGEAKNYVNFARLPYCQTSELQSNTCGACQINEEQGFKVAHVESHQKDGISFTLVVSASESGEVVISLGGPKSENVEYLQQIYANGMQRVPELNNLLIENEFWDVYSTFFRQTLLSTLESMRETSKKIVFVGHSFGGSLAFMAAYDAVFNQILPKHTSLGPYVFTYGALKIGNSGFSQVIHRYIGPRFVRIRRSVDFFTLMPRCVYIADLSVWHCYRSYVNLVRAFPMFGYYYSRFSTYIRKQLIQHIPSIIRNAQSYVHQPVAVQVQKSVNVENGNMASTSSSQTRHTQLNSVLTNQNKSNDRSFINKISDVFGHKQITPSMSQNNNNRERLADYSPLKYSGISSGRHASDRHHHPQRHHHSQERLASHEPLAYSTPSAPSSYQNKHFSPHHVSKSHSYNNFSEFEKEREKFSSHIPQKYSGLHSHSLSNSHSYMGRSGASSSRNHSAPHHYQRKQPEHHRIRNFLETGIKVKKLSKNKKMKKMLKARKNKNDFFKYCITYGSYVRCKFTPEIHRIFYGVDIESC